MTDQTREPLKPGEKRLIGTIDLTPTWSDILPTLLTLNENGNAEGRATARSELTRMAKLADLYVAAQKQGKVA